MTDTMWFVLITLILAGPLPEGSAIPGSGAQVPGDVIESTLLGAADTLDDCEVAGRASVAAFGANGGDAVVVTYSCVEMAASVGVHQGFEPTRPE